ncbi:MAG TPA: class I SAM-dependent methyltransferase [Candidatus Hydrogenedens sp.]|nr:class I SAM-dependent methyltransferase [Candidatus Hydrogenedens sp.]
MLERQPEPEFMDDPLEAEAYSVTDFSDVNQKFVDTFCAALPLSGNLLILDLGCGPGDITYRMHLCCEQHKIIGIDGSPSMLRFAQKQSGSRSLTWVLADAKCLPFVNESVDVILSNSLLHHIWDPKPLWMEIKRVIKSGGFLFLRDLFRPESEREARKIVELYAGDASDLLKQEYYRSLLSAFTPEEIQEQLAECGLEYLSVKCVTDRHVDIFGTIV